MGGGGGGGGRLIMDKGGRGGGGGIGGIIFWPKNFLMQLSLSLSPLICVVMFLIFRENCTETYHQKLISLSILLLWQNVDNFMKQTNKLNAHVSRVDTEWSRVVSNRGEEMNSNLLCTLPLFLLPIIRC